MILYLLVETELEGRTLEAVPAIGAGWIHFITA
jgi:hypothetical protein